MFWPPRGPLRLSLDEPGRAFAHLGVDAGYHTRGYATVVFYGLRPLARRARALMAFTARGRPALAKRACVRTAHESTSSVNLKRRVSERRTAHTGRIESLQGAEPGEVGAVLRGTARAVEGVLGAGLELLVRIRTRRPEVAVPPGAVAVVA